MGSYPDPAHARANGEMLPSDLRNGNGHLVYPARLSVETQEEFFDDRTFFKDGHWWRDGSQLI